jgi:hypothetical protein
MQTDAPAEMEVPRCVPDEPSTDAFARGPEAQGGDPMPGAADPEQVHELFDLLKTMPGVSPQDLEGAFADLPPDALEFITKLARGGGG